MLAHIFRNFSATTVAPLMHDLKLVPEMVLRPKDGVHIQFKLRNGENNYYKNMAKAARAQET